MTIGLCDAIAEYITNAYGFIERFDAVPANKYEEKKESFYGFISHINRRLSCYIEEKYPVKTKNIDYDDFRVVERIFKNGMCQIVTTLKSDGRHIYSKRLYVMIYYQGRIMIEFFLESPHDLDKKICELTKQIPDFKSEVRNIKLDMLI